jgi:CHASE3 domain sensor protein
MVNLSDEGSEKSQPPRASKTAVLLMAVIVICLAMLAVFANVQRSRRGAVEVVRVKSTASPTPQKR